MTWLNVNNKIIIIDTVVRVFANLDTYPDHPLKIHALNHQSKTYFVTDR